MLGIKATLVAMGIGAAMAGGVLFAERANADPGTLTYQEKMEGDRFGGLYCAQFDAHPDQYGLRLVVSGIAQDGFTDARSMSHIIAYTINTYCPRHVKTLENIMGDDYSTPTPTRHGMA